MALPKKFDLSLYLVTDSTEAILGDRDLVEVVESSLKNGDVTIVQYRDKHNDTGALIKTARELKNLTQKYGVPLIINDRVDVAVAIEADGVHLGQDDMDYATARKILGPDAIIGISTCSAAEAALAISAGADYLGIGTVFGTATKTNTKSIIGPAGVRKILEMIQTTTQPDMPTVAIGGIKIDNAKQVMHDSQAKDGNRKRLDGIAVVSAIIAAEDPAVAAQALRTEIKYDENQGNYGGAQSKDMETIMEQVIEAARRVPEVKPLCHNMTNLVVQNFAANVALCIGASPIMANDSAEAADLAALKGGLLINAGTVSKGAVENYLVAANAYKDVGGPVVLDPVGAGATQLRRDALKQMLAGANFTLIKGNEGEIKTVYGASGEQQFGVDSGPSTLSPKEKAIMVKTLALREKCIILMTGETDYLSDGTRTFAIHNGHEILGKVTGTGCTLGTTLTAYLAANPNEPLIAALAGILLYEVSAEIANKSNKVVGPGSFVPTFLDSLSYLSANPSVLEKEARLELVEV